MQSILNDYEEHSTTQGALHNDQTQAHKLPEPLMFLLQTRTTAEAIFVVDPNYRIVYWDTKAESLTGLLSEETIGRACQEVLGGECEAQSTSSNEQHHSVMHLAHAEHPSQGGYEMRIPTRWGKKRWVGVSNLSVQTEEGTYFIHLLRDTQAEHETLEMARALIEGFSSGKDTYNRDTYNRDTYNRDTYNRDTPELTPRQLEVLGMLACGKSAREICTELYLSQATVRNHIRALLLALGAHSQLEALAKARQVGLLVGG